MSSQDVHKKPFGGAREGGLRVMERKAEVSASFTEQVNAESYHGRINLPASYQQTDNPPT